jgi:crotonobetainyl-CoA:carnitine CoA-transferase CaiB-like acyl-CoA transferase
VNTKEATVDQALSDVRVLDLTHHLAGPYCTKLLADYGADVIKVERPGSGDVARSMGPFFRDQPHIEKSGLFLYLNTNKRSITLNLKTETGRNILEKLASRAEIVVESFSPRVMPSLGLDYETLERINPKLVMTSISNFGQTGPYRNFKASDIIEYGMGGEMCSTGWPDRYPLKLGGTVVLFSASLVAAAATMGAFYGSRYRGMGQHVDVSIMETQMGTVDRRAPSLIAYQYCNDINLRSPPAGFGLELVPPFNPCADGYFNCTVGIVFWDRLVRMLGDPRFEDSRYSPPWSDAALKAEFDETWIPWCMERSKGEIAQTMQDAEIVCTPINDASDVLADPQLAEREFMVEIDHPSTDRIKYPGAPFKMSETPWRVTRRAPMLGEHNDEVYGDLGYSKDDLMMLSEANVI